ncbi:helix-turn-helix domain-containing protein [Clostridium hydrogenum]|uniref:helix-turn-helix domain-containing protein n=1 Tax=Clostridium hydrogenum TaxID=2855764 RepID=UPI001F29D55B|nr:helix-turn-helix transcriptional regulator [Clostridium hydrogenum]
MDFKELITNKGFTMYRLAKQSGLGQSTINEIANGNRKNPNMNTLTSIADTLKTSVDELCNSLKLEEDK